MPVQPRSLLPVGLSQLGLGPLTPGPRITVTQPARFKIAIAADLAVNGDIMTFADLKSVDKSNYWAQNKPTLDDHDFTLIDSLGLFVANYDRSNKCSLTLTLDGSVASKSVDCSTILHNPMVRFQFDRAFAPGIYTAELSSTAQTEDNGVSAYLGRSAEGSLWAEAFSWPQPLNAFRCLRVWFAYQPTKAASYCCCFLVIAVLLLFRRQACDFYWLTILVCYFAGATLGQSVLSGFDETAHIDMLHKQVVLEQGEIGDSFIQNRIRFFRSVRQRMISGGFFRLHNVSPQQIDSCPHSILASCGESEEPQWFYRGYAKVISLVRPSPTTPEALRLIAQILNLSLLGLLIGGTRVLYGRSSFAATSFTLLTLGAVFSQVVTVSNDVPMLLIGMWGLVASCHLLTDAHRLRNWAGLGLYFLLLLGLGKKIDRSWAAGLPTLAIIPLAGLVGLNRKSRQMLSTFPGRLARIWGSASVKTAALAVVTISWTLIVQAATHSPVFIEFLRQYLQPVYRDIGMISGIAPLGVEPSLSMITSYLKSICGSFVWGHSYYDSIVYYVYAFGLVVLSAVGVESITRDKPFWLCLVILAVIGLLAASQFVAVLAVAGPYYSSPEVVWQAFTKARLFAPGLSCLLIAPFLGLCSLMKRARLATLLFTLACTWCLIFGLYYQLKFHIADMY